MVDWAQNISLLTRGWNFGVNVQGTSLRAVVSSVPSVRINSYAVSIIVCTHAYVRVCLRRQISVINVNITKFTDLDTENESVGSWQD